MWDIYAKYDVTSESLMLGLCVVVLLLMLVSQPRITAMYRMTVLGTVLGMVTIVIHQAMLYVTSSPVHFQTRTFNIFSLFTFVCFII